MSPDARRAIECDCARLINLYVNLNDTGQWHDLAALFAEDGVMARPAAPDASIVGRDAILASFLNRPARVSRHVCANIVVDAISDTEARAVSTILLFTGTANAGALATLDSGPPKIGMYDDQLIRIGSDWKFAARHGKLLFAP